MYNIHNFHNFEFSSDMGRRRFAEKIYDSRASKDKQFCIESDSQ